jgi:hypothetical protein
MSVKTNPISTSGKKRAETIMQKYGSDFYQKIGQKGGKKTQSKSKNVGSDKAKEKG